MGKWSWDTGTLRKSEQHQQTKKRALAPELLASLSNRSEVDSNCVDKNHVAHVKE
jgi:hypothetical protein